MIKVPIKLFKFSFIAVFTKDNIRCIHGFYFCLITFSQLINPVISLTNTSISGISISFATKLISNVACVNGCSLCQAQANPLYLRPYIVRIRAFKRDSSAPLCYARNDGRGKKKILLRYVLGRSDDSLFLLITKPFNHFAGG